MVKGVKANFKNFRPRARGNTNMVFKRLRGSVPKNGPIDFASKNHFSLNSADGKSLIPKY